jgi:hypothetical protein
LLAAPFAAVEKELAKLREVDRARIGVSELPPAALEPIAC